MSVNNMPKNIKKALIFAFNVMTFFVISLLHNSAIMSFKIFEVSFVLIIPLIVAFSLNYSPLTCAIAGALSGIIIDSAAANVYCFNAIVLLIIGAGVAVTSNTLFNKNIPSVLVISLLCSMLYFILHWAFFHTFTEGVSASLSFLLYHSLPSAVISTLFVFPFYYLYKYVKKLNP